MHAAGLALICCLRQTLSICVNMRNSFHGKQPAAVIRVAIVEIHADSRSRRALRRKRGGKYDGISRRALVGGNVYLANIERGVCGGWFRAQRVRSDVENLFVQAEIVAVATTFVA